MSAPTLALIAGAGAMPWAVARACEASGRALRTVALSEFADADFARHADDLFRLDQLGTLLAHLAGVGVTHVTFAGRIERPSFASFRPDAATAPLMPPIMEAARRGDDAILSAVVATFEAAGLGVVAPETLDLGLRAGPGPVGAKGVPEEHQADVARAIEIARISGSQDIGQGAVVCDGLVLAVEAQEGTDAMLARVADLRAELRGAPDARRGVLAKVAKPQQERRIDLPTIGVRTVAGAARAGLAGIVVEADGAIIVDRQAVGAAADAAGLFVVALDVSAV